MSTIWWVDGEQTGSLPIENRGLAYGDGLFETMRAVGGRIPLLDAHMCRLSQGAAVLDLCIELDIAKQQIDQALSSLSDKGWPQAVIKLILIRDGNSQGYGYARTAGSCYLIRASELVLPEQADILHTRVCKHQLSEQSVLAGVKHLNRLDQVMASRELENEQEGVLLDAEGFVQEGISSNILLVKNDSISTPALLKTGVKGVMRKFLKSQINQLPELEWIERAIHYSELAEADEIIFTNAVRGVRNAVSVRDIWASETKQVGDRLRSVLLEQLSKSFASF